ncbi:ATP-dependent RNA helicase HrpA [Pelistega europaea]|uniref:RNA helicase n=1 Tax=Pelistega europaea TaxID=106147 RepID=A0A7Y4L9W9_9BURK|nr:ATP-dependent RNA helicase HrpA [Pelistega europaea]NOL49655.1 ATP-dependent RNA helicase HrpA [Pelistega europaea]
MVSHQNLQKNPPRPLPLITYDDELPVSSKREEIAQAITQHQVVIICGETGSGKTTQLPKICLELGRGQAGLIGHTQPRRIAAVSVAKRIAQELKTDIGDWVGYQVRFNDKTGPNAAIKLMTDGILLAETQHDRLLRKYDTIIIDEAHERSLNIDFLLGLLKNILRKRPDLKLIITSATIDADRFAQHFADTQGKAAPVIEVSGRLYPVEVRYRPIGSGNSYESIDEDTDDDSLPSRPSPQAHAEQRSADRLERDEEKDLINAITDAVDECSYIGQGDILVFLPGEREIREAAEALRKHKVSGGMEVLPLFARMSQAEQERIFHPSTNLRRVILATNVAETSLTVPGIRFVIDSGLARVKRYSWRNKVEQLQIEKISQASANQRSGRCGRIGAGVCIRLYDELDFKRRPAFSDPEILRSSLASVILRMKALRLHDIEKFPFVDSPTGKAIADGYHILHELGALNEHNRLTAVGHVLAELPLDPKIARMILAGKEQNSLREVLVIAAALSVQDPRERPFDAKEQSTQAHAKFKDEKSEFISYLKLWDWYHDKVAHKESQRKLVAGLRKEFLSPIRLREWHDIHAQLLTLIAEKGWHINQTDATYEQIHKALLSGLLGSIGLKSEQDNQVYQGARDIRFVIHPSSTLAKKAGKWIMAGELVETSRLFARTIAKIEPQWIEQLASHLLKKQWSDPQWNRQRGQVQANERAALYGVQIYQGRKVHYGRINPTVAREVFIREALVPGDIDSQLPFIVKNRRLIEEIERLEHRTRRPDILVDEELIYAFYDQHISKDIYQTATLESWYKGLSTEQQQSLILDKKDLMRHEAAGVTTNVFPKKFTWDGLDLPLDYHFEPGSPKDGVTMTIPVYALRQIDAIAPQWLVPGMLREKVQLLLKSLPQKLRRHCVPLPEYARDFYLRHEHLLSRPNQPLLQALIDDIWEHTQTRVKEEDFKLETLPAHMFMIFKVVDEHGRMLSASRNLGLLKAEHAEQVQESFQKVAEQQVSHLTSTDNITDWDFGELPEILEIKRKNQSVIGYPALVDEGTHCAIDVFDELEQAQQQHKQGLLRLFKLAFKEQIKYWQKNIRDLTKMSMLYMPLGTQEDLLHQIIDRALIQAALMEPLPHNKATFEQRKEAAKEKLGLLVNEVARLALQILEQWQQTQKKMGAIKAHKNAYQDMMSNQSQLMTKRFLLDHDYEHLSHFVRYLKADFVRAEKLQKDPARDAKLMADMAPLVVNYQRAFSQLKGREDKHLEDFRWLLQELRVALFAQELRTPMPVSVKRLQKVWLSVS